MRLAVGQPLADTGLPLRDGEQKDIAWFYPAVYDEVEAIAGYIAFYADRVEIESEENDER